MGSLPILPTISTSFIVISAILVAVGWYFIRQKQVEKHEKTMWLAAAFALAFFIIYLSRTIFIGNTSFGAPDHLKIYYTLFLFFHIFLATAGAVFGIVTLLSAVKKNWVRHKKLDYNHKRCLVFHRDNRRCCVFVVIRILPRR